MNLFLLRLKNGYAYIVGLKSKQFIVSPYHVFCNTHLENRLLCINSSTFYRKDITFKIGRIMGALNSELDLVVAEIIHPNTNTDFNSITIDSSLVVNNPTVSYFLKTDEYQSAQNISITFQNHQQVFKELIVCTKISQKGYSGKLVINSNNTLIGMLIGDSLTKSYILPISVIQNYLKNSFKFKKNILR